MDAAHSSGHNTEKYKNANDMYYQDMSDGVKSRESMNERSGLL